MRHLEKNTLDYTLFNYFPQGPVLSMTSKVFNLSQGERILQCNTRANTMFNRGLKNKEEIIPEPKTITEDILNNSFRDQLKNNVIHKPIFNSNLEISYDRNIINTRNFKRVNLNKI